MKTVEKYKEAFELLTGANSAIIILFIPRYYFAIINREILWNQDNNINPHINTSIDFSKSHTGLQNSRKVF